MKGLKIRSGLAAGKNYLRHNLIRKFDPRPRVFILVYHRVLPDRSRFDPYGVVISETTFRSQVEHVKTNFPVITLGELARQYKEGRYEAPIQAILTFDDGYLDNYTYAFPVLNQLSVQATFFLITDIVGTERPLWDYELGRAVLRSPKRNVHSLDLPFLGKMIRLTSESDLAWLTKLNEGLKSLIDSQRRPALRSLCQQYDFAPDSTPECDRSLAWDQVAEMQDSGMEIGAHSCSHPSLARISTEAATLEIERSKVVIESKLGKPCRSFAFPYGSDRDFNDGLIQHVEKTGYDSCVLNVHGYNCVSTSRFRLRRIIASEHTDLKQAIG